jgi:purine-nucleoside phosphorylase
VEQRLDLLSDQWRDRVATALADLMDRGMSGRVGLVLGSGLGDFVDRIDDRRAVDYGEIPGFSVTSVAEHRGQLVAGRIGEVPVVVLQGRLHPYEGHPPAVTLLPIAVLAMLGVETVVLTNAAGGLDPHYQPGDLMVIRDQIDLHWQDPLRGLLADPLGAGAAVGRVPGPLRLYDRELSRALADAAAAAGVTVRQGVYASVWGPNYEPKVEIGMLRRMHCQAVGMSTAPEAALLHALGVRVVGLSCITNPSRETGQPELSHQDVVEAGAIVSDRVAAVLEAAVPRLIAAER